MTRPDRIAVIGDGLTAKAVRAKLSELGISEGDIETSPWVVVSPGIPPDQFPQTQGEIISEIELAYRLFQTTAHPPRLIGITGTNGKSTVTAMIAHTLHCPVAGNFGIPLIQFVGQDVPIIAVELSSYQLETCREFHPEVAIILNLSPDHLDWHKTMAAYGQAKAKITQAQGPNDLLIIPEDPTIQALVANTQAQKCVYSSTNSIATLIKLPHLVGPHNHLNAIAAFLACQATGLLPAADIFARLTTFKALEHRIEWVTTWQDRHFYNDSKGTNPDATEIAVASFSAPIRLLLGGKDKHLDLLPFMTWLRTKVASIIVYGEISPRTRQVAHQIDPNYPITQTTTLDEALTQSVAASQPGDIILLSPACSSFDQYKNFEERGRHFKALVTEHYGQA